jgi:hypothetical protein
MRPALQGADDFDAAARYYLRAHGLAALTLSGLPPTALVYLARIIAFSSRLCLMRLDFISRQYRFKRFSREVNFRLD